MTIHEVRELFDYNRWARERVLDAATALPHDALVRDMGSSFPSVRDTLVHIMSAEWVWLSRWRGDSPTAMPQQWKTLDLDGIRLQWEALDREAARYLAGLGDADLERVIDYQLLSGQAAASTLSQMLRHVINHSTYHRGQVTTMLRQLGATPPATDLILFYRMVAAPAV